MTPNSPAPSDAMEPIIGLICCRKPNHEGRADLDEFVVGEKYVAAVQKYVGTPWPIVPTTPTTAASICARLDGLLLTGSLSNVHPNRYKEPASEAHQPFDPSRDDMTWALLDAAVARGIPILAICRGHQELNAYFGGSLHARVHETEGLMDHRAKPEAIEANNTNQMYDVNHPVNVAVGGTLAKALGHQDPLMVNSLHWQGIARLGDGLAVEATAPDGLVEAISIQDYSGWSLGVQWHPEFNTEAQPHYRAIFDAFRTAATEYRNQG